MPNDKNISASALILAIRDDSEIGGRAFARVKKHIEDAPAVDAVEMVHGRWIPAGKTEELAKCSVCGAMNHTLDYVFLLNMKYCPYCGAKMDGDWNG